jgi:DNA uptake protein ComE-like DNA-binding protein
MRTSVTRVAVISLMVLVLAPGCGSMMKRWDNATGKSDGADRKQGTVELNSAGRKRLAQLPGLTGDDADRIIANRPYEKRRDLVSKGVLSESKFDKIRDDVYVDHGKN